MSFTGASEEQTRVANQPVLDVSPGAHEALCPRELCLRFLGQASSDWRTYCDGVVCKVPLLCGFTGSQGGLSPCHSTPLSPGPLSLKNCLFLQICQNLVLFKTAVSESRCWLWASWQGVSEGGGRQEDRHTH